MKTDTKSEVRSKESLSVSLGTDEFSKKWKVKAVPGNDNLWVAGQIGDGIKGCFSMQKLGGVGAENAYFDIAYYEDAPPAELMKEFKHMRENKNEHTEEGQGWFSNAIYYKPLDSEKHLDITLQRILKEEDTKNNVAPAWDPRTFTAAPDTGPNLGKRCPGDDRYKVANTWGVRASAVKNKWIVGKTNTKHCFILIGGNHEYNNAIFCRDFTPEMVAIALEAGGEVKGTPYKIDPKYKHLGNALSDILRKEGCPE